MSKRLIRIAAGKFIQRAGECLSRDISVVMLNGNTIFGTLISSADGNLVVKDKRNHAHTAKLADVYEIVYDF